MLCGKSYQFLFQVLLLSKKLSPKFGSLKPLPLNHAHRFYESGIHTGWSLLRDAGAPTVGDWNHPKPPSLTCRDLGWSNWKTSTTDQSPYMWPPVCHWAFSQHGSLRGVQLLTRHLKAPGAGVPGNKVEDAWLFMTQPRKSHSITFAVLQWSQMRFEGKGRRFHFIKGEVSMSLWTWLKNHTVIYLTFVPHFFLAAIDRMPVPPSHQIHMLKCQSPIWWC